MINIYYKYINVMKNQKRYNGIISIIIHIQHKNDLLLIVSFSAVY